MKTYIDWAPSVKNGAKIIRRLPETTFECPKLNRGDVISLDVGRTTGSRTLTPVKVAAVNISISWDSIGAIKEAEISDAEQYLYIEPVIMPSNQEQ